MTELALSSLSRRLKVLHSLWNEAVATMSVEQVNHVEREPVLPIAFSLFHMAQIEDGASTVLGAGPMVYDNVWRDRIGLSIDDHGKERTVAEMMDQRIKDLDAFSDYMHEVFGKTERWLEALDPGTLGDVVVRRPLPATLASTFSARVAGVEGITRLDAVECWIYQHGLRHMGEIEHARALVGLGGMTS